MTSEFEEHEEGEEESILGPMFLVFVISTILGFTTAISLIIFGVLGPRKVDPVSISYWDEYKSCTEARMDEASKCSSQKIYHEYNVNLTQLAFPDNSDPEKPITVQYSNFISGCSGDDLERVKGFIQNWVEKDKRLDEKDRKQTTISNNLVSMAPDAGGSSTGISIQVKDARSENSNK